MAAKKSTCAREGYLKKGGIFAGGNHFFICTLCSKTTLRLETFKNGGILQLAAMFCQGVLFTLVKKALSRNDLTLPLFPTVTTTTNK